MLQKELMTKIAAPVDSVTEMVFLTAKTNNPTKEI
jgi:hypothetical protein